MYATMHRVHRNWCTEVLDETGARSGVRVRVDERESC